MKRWAAVEVVWDDANGGASGWHPTDSILHKPRRVRTVGLLWKDTDIGVTVAQSYDKAEDYVDSTVFIPKVNIVSLRELA